MSMSSACNFAVLVAKRSLFSVATLAYAIINGCLYVTAIACSAAVNAWVIIVGSTLVFKNDMV